MKVEKALGTRKGHGPRSSTMYAASAEHFQLADFGVFCSIGPNN
jgi:hypothetical protein